MDTEVIVNVEAGEEIVVVRTATEEQSVEGKVAVGQVLAYTVDVIVAAPVEEALVETVGLVEEVIVFEEDVVVIRQEHAELTREGLFLHWVENGPSPEVVAV
jgi:hypothetical protein